MIKICIEKRYNGLLELRAFIDGRHQKFRPFREIIEELEKTEDMMKFLRTEKSICPVDMNRWLQVARIIEMPIHIAVETKKNHLSPLMKVHPELLSEHKRNTHIYLPLVKVYPNGKVRHLYPRHPRFGVYCDMQEGELLVIP